MKSTMEPTSWRSLIKVHPAAEMFPEMEGDEFKSLVEDIRQHGLKTAIHTWFDKDEQEWLLDGRNRLNALEELGYRFKIVKTSGYGSDRPHLRITKPGSKETEGVAQHFARGLLATEPYSYVTSLNIHRRHLTTAQKGELIEKLLKADPAKSDRAVAKLAHVDNKTVAAKREQLEAGEEIPHQEARVGRDGKVQPAAKKSARKVGDAPALEYEPDPGWKEIEARDDIQVILAACAPLTPKDREFLRIALIECHEMRALALAPRVKETSLPINVRARLAIHALGEWNTYFTASLASLINGPNEDLDPGIRAELMEAFSVSHGVMTLGPAPVALHSDSDVEPTEAAAPAIT